MDMSGERRLAAPRQAVWEALNDPEVLKACIPGCDKLEKTSDTEMTATVAVKIGPISARFGGKVTLSDIDAPNSYTISGEGQGGVAGFGKGGAAIKLQDADGGGTLLTYEVKAQVGGKIAQLGARLIDATAKQMADTFFDRFAEKVAVPVAAPAVPEAGAAAAEAAPEPVPHVKPVPRTVGLIDLIPPEPLGIPIIGWVSGAVALVILAVLFGSYLK
jgi:uncharacterized protein